MWYASRRAPSISASGWSGECERVPVERVTSTGDNEGPATIETEKRAARWPPRSGGRATEGGTARLCETERKEDVVGVRNGTNDESRASRGARGWDTTI